MAQARQSPPPTPTASAWDQAHIDIGALAQRVTGTEGQITSLAAQVATFQRDTVMQFRGLEDSFASQLRDIGAKIDRQNETLGASRDTNWNILIPAAGVIVSILVALGSLTVSPINEKVTNNREAINELQRTTASRSDFEDTRADIRRHFDKVDLALDAKWSEKEHTEYSKRIDEKIAQIADNLTRANAQNAEEVKTILASLVPRAEHTARWAEEDARLNALSVRINEMQHEFGSNFTLGDAVKELQSQLKELRLQAAPPVIVQTKPQASQ